MSLTPEDISATEEFKKTLGSLAGENNPKDYEMCDILGWPPELYQGYEEVLCAWPSVTTDDSLAVQAFEEFYSTGPGKELGAAQIDYYDSVWRMKQDGFFIIADPSFAMSVCKCIKKANDIQMNKYNGAI